MNNAHLFSAPAIDAVRESQAEWEEGALAAFLKNRPEEKDVYETESGIPLKRIYTAADVADIPAEELGFPGPIPSPAASTRRCIAAAPGRSVRSPASAIPRRRTSATST
ncbi:hypothetical protein [Shinella sp. JR1-6]|uniref:hypothetical protein n=1 Tax=Shinella sp. JR1-6 TaxID=2527671 RepID=UPI001FE16DCD|nr:hypothetical protein [Shinella sp. JR1-6]